VIAVVTVVAVLDVCVVGKRAWRRQRWRRRGCVAVVAAVAAVVARLRVEARGGGAGSGDGRAALAGCTGP